MKISDKTILKNKNSENSQKFVTKCLKLLHNSFYIISVVFVKFWLVEIFKFWNNDVYDIFYDLWSFCTDSLEFLKPEDAQECAKTFVWIYNFNAF